MDKSKLKKKPDPTEKVCRLCHLPKPIEQFRLLITNKRANKKGILVMYQYREGRCDECRTNQNREKMRQRQGYYKRRKEEGRKRSVQSATSPYTKQTYDNRFVFSSNISHWH